MFGVAPNEPFFVYPVRSIRRKNTGELLLWAAASAGKARFAITLPPLNPVEKPRYEAWKQLARQLQLPLLFDVGADGGLSYGENLASAEQTEVRAALPEGEEVKYRGLRVRTVELAK